KERVAALAVPLADAQAAVMKAPKRAAIIEALAEGPVAVAALGQAIKGAATAVRELAKAQLVAVTEREIAPSAAPIGDGLIVGAIPTPTVEQATAVAEIMKALDEPAPFTPFLLHGVTGSGKTEVYLRVIAAALAANKTALVLVPEISLTPQLAARFRARFGDQVAILHSGLSEQSRLGEWSRLRRGQARIAVGARSAILAPPPN